MIGLIISTVLINVVSIIFFIYLCLTKDFTAAAVLNLFIIILFMIFFNFIVFEKVYNEKIRKSFKYIIHVNGIRGKSTTTRLIDAGLRACGFKVFTKTTGTMPVMINVDDSEKNVFRLGKANIREQLKMLRLAYKQKAEVVVLECMAVNPELQYICEHQILHADVTVITNVRPDHIQDMGESLEDIAKAFCNTIPTNGDLVINEGEFKNIFIQEAKKLNTKVHVSTPFTGVNTLETFEENIQLALEVAKVLNLDADTFFEGMKNYHHDMGAYEKIKINDTILLNGFSINDPVSIKVVYDKIIEKYDSKEITILLNSRNDRPTRVMQHIELMNTLPCKKILLSGSNTSYVKKKILKLNPKLNIEILREESDLFKEKLIFGVGNIGGAGMKILKYFQDNGERI